MRRTAAFLLLFLAACQSREQDARLDRIEKKLDQIQQQTPVASPASDPNPALTTASAMSAEVPIPDRLLTEDAEKLLGPHSAFVSTPTQSNIGFYCVMNRQILLYKWNETAKVYRLIGVMADYRRLKVQIVIQPALIDEMRDLLTRPEEKP